MKTCSLFINAARPDVPFLRPIVEHLVRSSAYPFLERVLVADTAPLPPRYAAMNGVPTQEEFDSLCDSLLRDGVVDRVLRVDYSPAIRGAVMRMHLGSPTAPAHDYRGGPIYPYLFAIEQIPGDYLLHFDGDMLLHQPAGKSWIEEGIALMEDREDILCVNPHPGPPAASGTLRQRDVVYTFDEAGFYRFQMFTARRFLLSRKRLGSLLPLRTSSPTRRHRLRGMLGIESGMQTWELMLSAAMERGGLHRADLQRNGAWSLHTPDHGEEFLRCLHTLIDRVERGDFPPGQAGDYDLKLPCWQIPAT